MIVEGAGVDALYRTGLPSTPYTLYRDEVGRTRFGGEGGFGGRGEGRG